MIFPLPSAFTDIHLCFGKHAQEFTLLRHMSMVVGAGPATWQYPGVSCLRERDDRLRGAWVPEPVGAPYQL